MPCSCRQSDRFEWVVEADIRPTTLNLTSQEGKQVYFLHFWALDGTNLSAAARVRTDSSGSILAGIAAEQPDRSRGGNSTFVIVPLSCRHWKLHLRRVGTRETTAELYLDDVEAARLLWNPTTTYEPRQVRVGIGRSFSQVKATLNTDNVLVSEKTF
ncbi:hypothetical protein [Scytonema hofmannii]|uniref:hypothetical protein n=1 Tax=Scytonema hofmannii TaxID=34078 RepID=UPI001314CFF2|nr:hypothetical protein [Scytonema hofmannii]